MKKEDINMFKIYLKEILSILITLIVTNVSINVIFRAKYLNVLLTINLYGEYFTQDIL